MADVDIDPFGEHDRTESRTDEPMDEHIPHIPGVGGSTWEPGQSRTSTKQGEQETSFGGTSHTSVLHKEYLVGEIYELIGNKIHQKLEPNLLPFKLGEDGGLYHRGKPLMKWRAKNDWCHSGYIRHQRTLRDALQHIQN